MTTSTKTTAYVETLKKVNAINIISPPHSLLMKLDQDVYFNYEWTKEEKQNIVRIALRMKCFTYGELLQLLISRSSELQTMLTTSCSNEAVAQKYIWAMPTLEDIVTAFIQNQMEQQLKTHESATATAPVSPSNSLSPAKKLQHEFEQADEEEEQQEELSQSVTDDDPLPTEQDSHEEDKQLQQASSTATSVTANVLSRTRVRTNEVLAKNSSESAYFIQQLQLWKEEKWSEMSSVEPDMVNCDSLSGAKITKIDPDDYRAQPLPKEEKTNSKTRVSIGGVRASTLARTQFRWAIIKLLQESKCSGLR